MTEEEYAALAEKQRAAAGKGNVEEKPEETKAEDLEVSQDQYLSLSIPFSTFIKHKFCNLFFSRTQTILSRLNLN